MIRGRKIAWIPQNPTGAINPSMTVGNQIGEPISLHIEKDINKIRKKVLELLHSLG